MTLLFTPVSPWPEGLWTALCRPAPEKELFTKWSMLRIMSIRKEMADVLMFTRVGLSEVHCSLHSSCSCASFHIALRAVFRYAVLGEVG